MAEPAKPAVDMRPDFVGTLAGGDAQASAMPDRGARLQAQQIEQNPRLAEAAGITAMAGIGAGVGAIAGPTIASAAARHPVIASAVGSELINQARKIPVAGKFIPPYAEWLPFLLGGKGKSEAESTPNPTPAAQMQRTIEAQSPRAAQDPFPRVSEGPPGGKGDVSSPGADLRGEVAQPPEPSSRPVPLGNLPQPKGNPYSSRRTPPMEPAQSTNITLHGYDPASQTLVVQFKNGNVYEYRGVPQEVFNKYRASESQGSFLANQIKGRYTTILRGTVKPARR
jgi:hypothetical protein